MNDKNTGVSFDGMHTYRDFSLKLKNIDIEFPDAKYVYVDIPGMDGELDLTEAQNGGVVYGTRLLSFTFDAKNCKYTNWVGLISRIARCVEGKKKKITLDIDKGYYYTGRCHVSTKKSNEVNAEIVIECKCDPFKLASQSSDEKWVWDTFSFIDGVIRNTASIRISSPTNWQNVKVIGWMHNETIVINASSSMQVKHGDNAFDLLPGDNIMYGITIKEGENILAFKGNGIVKIIHRGGII